MTALRPPRNAKRRPADGGGVKEAVAADTSVASGEISDANVEAWHQRLMRDDELVRWWRDVRGVKPGTLIELQIGWDGRRYTIPIRDVHGVCRNVRRYLSSATPKVLHTKGYGSPPRLMGADRLPSSDPKRWVVIAAGEADAIRLTALGLLALSGTGGEMALPRDEDLALLRGRQVVVVYDMDETGRKGADKLCDALLNKVGVEWVRNVEWPKSWGKDATDLLLNEGWDRAKFIELVKKTERVRPLRRRRPVDSLLDLAMKELDKTDSRGLTGMYLACQIRDEGYPQDEADTIMLEYQGLVDGLKDQPYTESEALAAVRDAYGREPREPSGLGTAGELAAERMTDTGNALRMARQNTGRILYCPAFKKWLVFDGVRWARDDGLEIMKIAKAVVRSMWVEAIDVTDKAERKERMNWCKQSEATARLKAMVENCQSEMVVLPTQLDADPMLLCVENGTLDLRTGDLRPHDPGDLITLVAPVVYDPDATDARWEETLDRFVRPDEGKEEFLQRAAFASLTGTTTDKAFINLFDGNDGNTGKTTFAESLRTMLGPYAAVVAAEAFLSRPGGAGGIRADIASLAGKRMAISSETPPNRKLDTALMKRLTQGGGTYQFERKFENPWEGPITFTIWLDGNSVAKANAEDHPLFRRWRLTPFKHVIDGAPDPHWTEKACASPEYRAAVLAWAMKGRREWLAGGIGSAPFVDAAVDEVRAEMDPLTDYWDESCEFGKHTRSEKFFATTAELYSDYTIWAHSLGVRPINKDAFLSLLKGRGAEKGSERIAGKVTPGWKNVRLRPVAGPKPVASAGA